MVTMLTMVAMVTEERITAQLAGTSYQGPSYTFALLQESPQSFPSPSVELDHVTSIAWRTWLRGKP